MFIEAEQKGRQEGRQQGRQEGLREGLQAGELAVLRGLIEKRFGPSRVEPAKNWRRYRRQSWKN